MPFHCPPLPCALCLGDRHATCKCGGLPGLFLSSKPTPSVTDPGDCPGHPIADLHSPRWWQLSPLPPLPVWPCPRAGQPRGPSGTAFPRCGAVVSFLCCMPQLVSPSFLVPLGSGLSSLASRRPSSHAHSRCSRRIRARTRHTRAQPCWASVCPQCALPAPRGTQCRGVSPSQLH